MTPSLFSSDTIQDYVARERSNHSCVIAITKDPRVVYYFQLRELLKSIDGFRRN